MHQSLAVSTRKGLFIYAFDGSKWQQVATHFLSIPVTFFYEDPRNGTWFACLDHGHWGIKLHRSRDKGAYWTELEAPKYPEGYKVNNQTDAKTEYIWSMTHGGYDRPNELWMGTIPGGLFLSEDGGDSWTLNEALWQDPSRTVDWFGAGFDHPGIHSIIVDPRDSDHITVGISVAGVFVSKDRGQTWLPKNKGLIAEYLPDHHAVVGHDPHILVGHEKAPDVFWQQNHCGVFLSDDACETWTDVSEPNGAVGFGFGLAVDEADPQIAWVAPAIGDEFRVAVDEALVIFRTEDGGQTWKDLRSGLPQNNCYDIVYRHALAAKGDVVAFGTTTGNLFLSDNRGEDWQVLNNYLPMVHAVCFVVG